jgi:hypothetical protein
LSTAILSLLWAKNLPRLNCFFQAFSREPETKSQDRPIKSERFWEVLRPKEGSG